MKHLSMHEHNARSAAARASVLTDAQKAVMSDRNRDYGDPENNFADIARLWNAWLFVRHGVTVELDAIDVAQMMIQVKQARSKTSPTVQDHWTDLAGYAACGYGAALSVSGTPMEVPDGSFPRPGAT